MALDACYLSFLVQELNERIAGARVEKVYQPGKDEVLIHLREQRGRSRLLFCCTPNCARITLTEKEVEIRLSPLFFAW